MEGICETFNGQVPIRSPESMVNPAVICSSSAKWQMNWQTSRSGGALYSTYTSTSVEAPHTNEVGHVRVSPPYPNYKPLSDAGDARASVRRPSWPMLENNGTECKLSHAPKAVQCQRQVRGHPLGWYVVEDACERWCLNIRTGGKDRR
jgi:hypothetical protein